MRNTVRPSGAEGSAGANSWSSSNWVAFLTAMPHRGGEPDDRDEYRAKLSKRLILCDAERIGESGAAPFAEMPFSLSIELAILLTRCIMDTPGCLCLHSIPSPHRLGPGRSSGVVVTVMPSASADRTPRESRHRFTGVAACRQLLRHLYLYREN